MKLKLKVRKASGETIAEWIVNMISKRMGVKPPIVTRSKSKMTGFRYPNVILLSGDMFYDSVQKFVAMIIHEMAHYVHLGKMTKVEYRKTKRQHNKDFFETLKMTANAAYGAMDGYRAYPWIYEYPRLIKYAAKEGLVKVRERKTRGV